MEDAGGPPTNSAQAGPSQPQARVLRSAVEMERADPLYTPSILPPDKGFMRDASLLKRLDHTPLPDERLKLASVKGVSGVSRLLSSLLLSSPLLSSPLIVNTTPCVGGCLVE